MPKRPRPPKELLVVATPYMPAPTVTIYDQVWERHVIPNHPELFGRIADVQQTLQAPTAVCAATNPATNLAFVNHDIVINGDPLVVFVAPEHPLGPNSLVSAYPAKKFADLTKQDIKWKP